MQKYHSDTYQGINKIFGNHYQIIFTILNTEKYHSLKLEWYKKYKNLGFPIPSNGFISELQYSKWERRVFFTCDSLQPTKAILEAFNLDVTNQIFKDFIHHDFYFNQEPEIPVFPYILINNGKQCMIQIFPWTTRDDIAINFENIKRGFEENFKKYYEPYTEKRVNQSDNFKRDAKLYLLYKKLKNEGFKGKKLFELMYKSDEYKRLVESLMISPNFDLPENMRTIASNFKKLLKDVNLQ